MTHKTRLFIFIFNFTLVVMFISTYGQTAVADSQVTYNAAKNNGAKAADATPQLSSTDVVGYDTGFFLTDRRSLFYLKINGMVKTRFDLLGDESVETAEGLSPSVGRTYHASFAVPFARLQFSGHVFSKRLKYNFFYNFPNNKLIYAWAAWHFIPKKLVIKAGLFKRPFGRAFLTSSVKRQFVDDPLGMLGTGRDTGVELGNCYDKVSGVEWAIGVFNGTMGTSGDFSPVITARVGYNNGIAGYAETDFEGGGLRYGIGMSASTEFDHDDSNTTVHHLSGDIALKVHGLSTSGAVYLSASGEKNIFDEMELSRIGGHLQAGYIFGSLVEPVLRYGFSHARHVKDDLEQEASTGIVLHFIPEHRFKWENNFSVRTVPLAQNNPQDALVDMRFVSQLQLYF